jgi:hypothetical protein
MDIDLFLTHRYYYHIISIISFSTYWRINSIWVNNDLFIYLFLKKPLINSFRPLWHIKTQFQYCWVRYTVRIRVGILLHALPVYSTTIRRFPIARSCDDVVRRKITIYLYGVHECARVSVRITAHANPCELIRIIQWTHGPIVQAPTSAGRVNALVLTVDVPPRCNVRGDFYYIVCTGCFEFHVTIVVGTRDIGIRKEITRAGELYENRLLWTRRDHREICYFSPRLKMEQTLCAVIIFKKGCTYLPAPITICLDEWLMRAATFTHLADRKPYNFKLE